MPSKRIANAPRICTCKTTLLVFFIITIFFATFMLIDAFTFIRDLPLDDHSSELELLRAQVRSHEEEAKIYQAMLDDVGEQNRKLHELLDKYNFVPYQESEAPDSARKKSTKSVFFDLGANRGDTTRVFVGLEKENKMVGKDGALSKQLYAATTRIKGPWDLRIYEANPQFDNELFALQDNLRELGESYGGPFDIYLYMSTAIGKEEGVTDFYLDGKSKVKWGSSLLKDHPAANGTVAQVNMHDLSKEIMGNYKIDDYVIIKMDIEGTEYELLTDLLIRGAFPFIDELYVEYHPFANKDNIKSCLSHILSTAGSHMRVGKWE